MCCGWGVTANMRGYIVSILFWKHLLIIVLTDNENIYDDKNESCLF